MSNTPALLREADAAEYLSTSVKTLQDWRLKGAGPAYVKLGRSVRYRLTDLDKFVAGNVVGGGAR